MQQLVFFRENCKCDSHIRVNPCLIPSNNVSLISHKPVCCWHHPQRLNHRCMKHVMLAQCIYISFFLIFSSLGICFTLIHKPLNLNPWKKCLWAFYTSICWSKKPCVFFFLLICGTLGFLQTFQKLFDSAIFLCNCVVESVSSFFSGGCLRPTLHLLA